MKKNPLSKANFLLDPNTFKKVMHYIAIDIINNMHIFLLIIIIIMKGIELTIVELFSNTSQFSNIRRIRFVVFDL